MAKLLLKKFTVLLPVILLFAGCGGGGPEVGEEGSGAGGDNVSIAFIKRTIPPAVVIPEGEEDDSEPFLNFEAFRPGSAAVFIGNTNSERQITPTNGSYDIRQLTVGYDGATLLFAMRGPLEATPEGEDEIVQPAWGIWEYTVASQQLEQLTQGDAANHIHDIDPMYLPDGRIVFSSSRQKTTITMLGDEGKVQYRHLTEEGSEEETDARTFNLHMLGVGRNENTIKQITFNQSHDFNPSLAPNGKVLFSRWDNNGLDGDGVVSIYRMNPDGSNVELLFGHNSQRAGVDPGVDILYTRPQGMDDGKVLVQLRADRGQESHLQLAVLDVENFIDSGVAVNGGSGAAVDLEYLGFTQTAAGVPALDGRLSAAVPTNDGTGRYLISWSLCQLVDGAGTVHVCSADNVGSAAFTEAPPFYGIFMYNPGENQKVPVVLPESGIYYTDLSFVLPRVAPSYIGDVADTADASLVDEGMGILHIRSVYNRDGEFYARGASASTLAEMKDPAIVPASDRPARFLRISRYVPQWDEDTRDIDNSFISGNGTMTEILGYAEIEPDGSVMTKVPADIAFTFSIVDGAGARISLVNRNGVRRSGNTRHDNWTQLRPGETLTCTGCHAHSDDDVAHGRIAVTDSVNTGAPNNGVYQNTDPAIEAVIGETMAETRARIDESTLTLSSDIVFEDAWAEPANKVASYSYTYQSIMNSFDTEGIYYAPPVNFTSCVSDWQSNCRVVINYETNIHPLWSKPRQVVDPDDADAMLDVTCTNCHNHDPDPDNANDPRTGGNSEVMEFPTPKAPPVQQLYLGNNDAINAMLAVSNNDDRFDAYDYLLGSNTHLRGIVEGGVLTKQTVEDANYDPVQEIDDEGSPVFEEDGVTPVLSGSVCELGEPTTRELLLSRSMDPGEAWRVRSSMVARDIGDTCVGYYPEDPAGVYNSNSSARSFFTKMENAPDLSPEATFAGETDHTGWLTGSELKLLKEWVDTGGQYYNGPFDAPAN